MLDPRTRTGQLSPEQLGHLRHFRNLARQLPNDWSLMQGRGIGQDDFGGYRFQLAYMAYALALTHRHRLPNAPGVFQDTFRRLIDKMMSPEVWMYWRDVSRGGSVYNAHLSDGYTEKWDPVARENIMYSAYVQSMALLYHHLFQDDRYAQPGALTFDHWSFFWGGEPKRFEYDERSLNEVVYWQMVESGYLGVACEPNCIFQICNQPAILGFRMHDLVYGGDTAGEVTEGYLKAWRDVSPTGQIGENGHYNAMVWADSRAVRANEGPTPWMDAWNGALLNMWHRDFVHDHYAGQVEDLIQRDPDGRVSVPPQPPREVMGRMLSYDWANHGWVAAWASEVGDEQTLAGLLQHSDEVSHPTWRDGGLYYPRNDDEIDAEGRSTLIDPMSGNVLIGYARLNVPDGLWSLYQQPWGAEHFDEPMVTAVGDDVEVLTARFDSTDDVLELAVRRRGDDVGDGTVVIAQLVDPGTTPELGQGQGVEARSVGGFVELSLTDHAVHEFRLRRRVGVAS